MRIGSYLFHYPEPSGTATAVRGLSAALARLGHEVIVYCCGPHAGTAEPPGVELVRFAKPAAPLGIAGALRRRLARNRDGLDLLLIHGIFNPRNIGLARAAHRGGVSCIVCPHGIYHPALLSKHRIRKQLYTSLFERRMLNAASAVQVLSENQIVYLRAFGVTAPAFAVPNGFDPEEVMARGAEPLEGDPVLVFFGRISMYTKGLDLLIDAIAKGHARGELPRSLRLHLFGADWGDKADLIRRVEECGIGSQVRFHDRVGEDRRWSVLASAELLVQTSRHDAFPTSVLEAMAVGRPVLLSTETGISPLVREAGCGFLVQPDVDSVLAGLREAIAARPRWPEMGRGGRQFAAARLTWDAVAREALQHYESVVGGRQRCMAA